VLLPSYFELSVFTESCLVQMNQVGCDRGYASLELEYRKVLPGSSFNTKLQFPCEFQVGLNHIRLSCGKD
jgi:hypothetical protein